MKREVEAKLDTIADVWNHFIWIYDFCKKEVKFNPEVRTNYFGDILGYFQDTFPIIFSKKKTSSYPDIFSRHISLLQSIYVQQDFIEELLIIFKCNITKGNLKSDPNYSINREIRNELIGHPIRRFKGELVSSCLFGYGSTYEKFLYMRYHKDNNYEFEEMKYNATDVISRHEAFLNTYFDKILNKLKRILKGFSKELLNFEKLMEKKNFDDVIRIASIYFESIFEDDFLYDAKSLKIVYERKDEHGRYQNLIDRFYADLKISIAEINDYIGNIIEPKQIAAQQQVDTKRPHVKIKFVNFSKERSNGMILPVTYHYELGKIATKRNLDDFNFFGGLLREKCSDNNLVIHELDHMASNIDNDIEYYTAYRLICSELKEE